MSKAPTSQDHPRMFPETQWTLVLAAGGTPSPESAAALGRLCSSYWYPLYAYVRRRGHSPPDAQDLTQEFFARLLEHNWIAPADRHKGRFRSFLLTAMQRFLAKEWDKVKTIKRGGQVRLVPLPLDTAETRYTREPVDTCTPEQVFEKQWALSTKPGRKRSTASSPLRFSRPASAWPGVVFMIGMALLMTLLVITVFVGVLGWWMK